MSDETAINVFKLIVKSFSVCVSPASQRSFKTRRITNTCSSACGCIIRHGGGALAVKRNKCNVPDRNRIFFSCLTCQWHRACL